MKNKEAPLKLPERILSCLRARTDSYFSGNELADELNVSRSAIWKAVEKLRADGYEIDAITNNGYRLLGEPDRLSVSAILAELPGPIRANYNVVVLESIDSTNDGLRRRAEEAAPEGTVLLAETQTRGRGRLNRSFYSPRQSGVYMSLLLRPTIDPRQSLLITTAAAVAVAEAIETCCGGETKIKWVNDIFMNGKKVSGILTEASLNLESGRLDYAVLGVGINLTEPEGGWPDELKEIAGSALARKTGLQGLRSRIAGTFLARFRTYYDDLPAKAYLAAYRERSLLIGKRILTDDGRTQRPATALAIDDDFRLIVRYDDSAGNETAALSTGEVSIRLPSDESRTGTESPDNP